MIYSMRPILTIQTPKKQRVFGFIARPTAAFLPLPSSTTAANRRHPRLLLALESKQKCRQRQRHALQRHQKQQQQQQRLGAHECQRCKAQRVQPMQQTHVAAALVGNVFAMFAHDDDAFADKAAVLAEARSNPVMAVLPCVTWTADDDSAASAADAAADAADAADAVDAAAAADDDDAAAAASASAVAAALREEHWQHRT